jgi:hypothetical protein
VVAVEQVPPVMLEMFLAALVALERHQAFLVLL